MEKQIKLSLSFDEAKLLHNGASQERKLELEELFPELKPISIIDRVKTYEDALEVLKRDHFDENNLYPREIARRKLEIIVEALNEGWKPDRKNASQLKWYPYFSNLYSTFGFSSASYSPMFASAYIDIRLCCKSEEIADYVGQKFLDLYKETFLG